MALGRSIFEAVLTITLFDNYITPHCGITEGLGLFRGLYQSVELSEIIIQIDKIHT